MGKRCFYLKWEQTGYIYLLPINETDLLINILRILLSNDLILYQKLRLLDSYQQLWVG